MEISTRRLLLRDVALEDFVGLHALETDPAVRRYRGGGQRSEVETRVFLHEAQTMLALDPRPFYALAVVLPADGSLIGLVTLTITNWDLGQAELGYRLGLAHWGQGYATEASQALVGFGFATLGLHRIYALCHPDNAGSRRVMEKLGMRYEGYLREDFRNRDGTWRDSLLYAILAQDWLALQRATVSGG